MSFNTTNGFTLSSFTNVRPTVSLSDAVTTPSHVSTSLNSASPINSPSDLTPVKSAESVIEEILSHQLDSGENASGEVAASKTVTESSKDNATQLPTEDTVVVLEEKKEDILDEGLVEEVESPIMEKAGVEQKSTVEDGEINDVELPAEDAQHDNAIDELEIATTGTNDLAPTSPETHIDVTPPAIILEDNQNQSKNDNKDDSDVDSSEEELEVLEDYKSETKPNTVSLKIDTPEHKHKVIDPFKPHLAIPDAHRTIGSDKDSSDEESIDEKMGLGHAEQFPISTEEKLINETLLESTEPNTQSTEDVKLSKEIDEEVENAVYKIRAMSTTDTQSIRSSESKIELIRRSSKSDSIKNISNPPDNLKKQEPFDFQTFLAQFKSKDCQPVHKYLKSFLNQFNQRLWSIEEQIKLSKEFQEFLFMKLIEYKPFNEIENDQNKINNCKEGLEKLVMTRIYSTVFSPVMSFIKLTDVHKNDKHMDKKYLINCYLFDWIELEHLDLNIKIDNKHIELARKELSHINEFKSPRDKIVCILNACKIIFNLIRQHEETQENADSFVPLLIYVLIQSKIKNLYSNLQYIERFRNDEFLVGETSYYVSTLEISVNFIINISKDQLTIDEQEFENNILESKMKLRELQKGSINEDSPSQVLTKSAEMVKQSLTNSFNTLLQNIVPEEGDEDEQGEDPHRPSPRETERAQLEEARIESLNEQQQQIAEQQQIQELQDIFPNLDPSLVADVYTMCEKDVSRSVDALLTL